MDNDDFLHHFVLLKDRWLPNLGVTLKILGTPKVEKKSYCLSADFQIKVDITQQVLNGNCGYNCSSQSEVNENINAISSAGCSGESEVLNNYLQDILSKNDLLELYRIENFSLQEYSYSCLMTCTDCNGKGSVSCGGCGGSGTVQESYQAHVSDNIVRDGQGYEISRTPIYETRYRTRSCYSCGGSGRKRCNTCNGDGVNTFKKNAEFYSCYENSKVQWSRFTSIPWVEKFIKNRNQESLDINSAVDWTYSDQTIQEKGRPGIYHVYLPGILIAAQCEIEASSQYAETSKGLCKILGTIPYDTDFIFDSHIRWTPSKSTSIKLTGEDLTPILSNPLVESCVRDMDYEYVPSGDLRYLNIIKNETSQSLQRLMRKLHYIHKANREKLSVFKLLLNTLFAGLALFAIIAFTKAIGIEFNENDFGLWPMLENLSYILQTIVKRSLNQVDGYIDSQMLMYIFLVFPPSFLLMKVFGSNKALTVNRMLKWYVVGGLFIVSFIFQFEKNDITSSSINTTIPVFDFLLISFLGGILWTRKGSFGRQKKFAQKYNSRKLMQLLGYEE